MNDGYIALWRKLRGNPLWLERRRFSKAEAWIDLLMDANWQDREVLIGNRMVPVRRGQALISQRKKAADWLWARNCVHAFIGLLEKAEMVSHEVSRGPEGGYTLLTILKYDEYQPNPSLQASDEVSHGGSHEVSHDRATPGPRPEQTKEGEEGKEGKEWKKEPSSTSGPTWAEYLQTFTPQDREVLLQVTQAIASTRKRGKVAPSKLEELAVSCSRFAPRLVLRAARIYLDRGHAREGKGEEYFLGILRGEAQRQSHSPDNGQQPNAAPKTEGQLVMERLLEEKRQELAS